MQHLPGDPFMYHTRQEWRKADLVAIARRRWRHVWNARLFKYRTLEFQTLEAGRANEGMTRVWQLYMTPIVVVRPDTSVVLDTGGWNTKTTRRRMTEVLRKRLLVKAEVFSRRNLNVLHLETPAGRKEWTFKRRLDLPMDTVREG
jgi:hypothetical protein